MIRGAYMKTKLDYYRIFYETARFSSFSSAAQHLYISQSAISQCIHQLETDLGLRLFARTRRGVSLTTEGALLFEKISTAMEAISQGETIMERLRHLESGALSIAAGDTVTSHYLMPYLEKFHANHPEIRIEMANSYSANMVRLVKEGKADLAFINLPMEDEALTIEPCLEIHDVFVAGKNFRAKKKYTETEIAELPLILLEKNSSSRHYLDTVFSEKGARLSPQIEIAAHDLLLRFAAIHLGVACVVEEFSKESLANGDVQKLCLASPLPPRHIGCAYIKDRPLSLAAKAFLELIRGGDE